MAPTGIPTGDGGVINPSDGGDGDSDGGGGGIDAGGFGEELGGDPAGDADRDTGQDDSDDIDTGGFGEELGGDPAGDADRDTDGDDDGQEDPADTDTGGFGEELGGDPAGDADRDTELDDPADLGAGGFGQELGGDPAGDADRDTGQDDPGGIDAGGFGEELGGDPAGETGVAAATEEAERQAVRRAAEERFPEADRIVIEEGDGIGEYRVDPWGIGAGQEVIYSFDRAETLSAVQEQMGRTTTVDLRSLGGDPAGRPGGSTKGAEIDREPSVDMAALGGDPSGRADSIRGPRRALAESPDGGVTLPGLDEVQRQIEAFTGEGPGPTRTVLLPGFGRTPTPIPDIADFRAIAQTSATETTPHVYMVTGPDSDAFEARAERELEFARLAESGFEDIQAGRAPSFDEAGGLLFQSGEIAERAITNIGIGIEEESPTAGMGPAIGGERLGDVPANVVSGLIGGVGIGIGAVIQGPVTGSDIGDEGPDISYGEAIVGTGRGFAEATAERPVSSAILLAAPAAAEGVPAGIRGYRATRGTRATVPESAITGTEPYPRFETRLGEPTSRAVSEVSRRASEQPAEVTDVLGSESVLYHSTADPFGRTFRVGEGASELPGMFTSPDASLIGLRNTPASGTRSVSMFERIRPSRPNLRTQPDRFLGVEGERIAAMPERASGFGYEVRSPRGDVVAEGLGRGQAKALAERQGAGYEARPQQSTTGYEFLTQEADPGAAYVRPRGSRTPELEAVVPPEAGFTRRGSIAVELEGGEVVPLDLYQRVAAAADEPAPRIGESTEGGRPSLTAGEAAIEYTPLRDAPTDPGATITQYSVGIGGIGTNTPTLVDEPSLTAEPSAFVDTAATVYDLPADYSAIYDVSGLTEPIVTVPSATEPPVSEPITSGTTTGEPTAPTSVGPSSPPSQPPTVGPSVPPSTPPSVPPSVPPSIPPSTPTPPPPPTRVPDRPPGIPDTPPPPPPPPPDTREMEGDADEREDELFFLGSRDRVITDFLDPLTGDVIETDADPFGLF